MPVRGRRTQLPIRPDGLVPSDAARWRRKARLRIKQEIDERAAADAGEGSRVKSQRKGKAKQTRAQELAEEALLQAEAELRICRMDEEGIDPEADTSDEDDYDEESNPDFDELLNTLVDDANGVGSDEPEDEEEDSGDDDDAHNLQLRRLLASLPPHMKPVALSAYAGDLAAGEKLRLYIESVAVSSQSEDDEDPSQDEVESDAQDENNFSDSDVQADLSSDDDDEDAEEDAAEQQSAKVVSNGASRKRKQLSPSSQADGSDPEEEDESDTVESDGGVSPVKRVKIAAQTEEIHLDEPSDEESEDGSQSLDSQDEEGDSSEEDDSDGPGFPLGADSGSEFGDVDEGEAELERLLAMAQDQDDDEADSAPTREEDEPQSFSRIPPHVLHQCFNVPDDPSRQSKDTRAKMGWRTSDSSHCLAALRPSKSSSNQARCSTCPPAGTTKSLHHRSLPSKIRTKPVPKSSRRARCTWRSTTGFIPRMPSNSNPSSLAMLRPVLLGELPVMSTCRVLVSRSERVRLNIDAMAPEHMRGLTAMLKYGTRLLMLLPSRSSWRARMRPSDSNLPRITSFDHFVSLCTP